MSTVQNFLYLTLKVGFETSVFSKMPKRKNNGDKRREAEEQRELAGRVRDNINQMNFRNRNGNNSCNEDVLLHHINDDMPDTFSGQFIEATIMVGVYIFLHSIQFNIAY